MGLYDNKYPYSDFHELNAQWLIDNMKDTIETRTKAEEAAARAEAAAETATVGAETAGQRAAAAAVMEVQAAIQSDRDRAEAAAIRSDSYATDAARNADIARAAAESAATDVAAAVKADADRAEDAADRIEEDRDQISINERSIEDLADNLNNVAYIHNAMAVTGTLEGYTITPEPLGTTGTITAMAGKSVSWSAWEGEGLFRVRNASVLGYTTAEPAADGTVFGLKTEPEYPYEMDLDIFTPASTMYVVYVHETSITPYVDRREPVNEAIQSADADIATVKADLTEYVGVVSTNNFDVTENTFINNNGQIRNTGGYSTSTPIFVNKGSIIRFEGKGYLTSVSMISTCDESGNSIVARVVSIDSTNHIYEYVATENTYIMVSYDNTGLHILTIGNEKSNTVLKSRLDGYDAKLLTLDNNINYHFDFSQPAILHNNHFINNNGRYTSTNGYGVYGGIIIPPNSTITVKAKGYLTNVAVIAKYDEITDTYTPLVISDSSVLKEYSYTSDNDDYIKIVISSESVNGIAYKVEYNNVNDRVKNAELSLYNNQIKADSSDVSSMLPTLTAFEKIAFCGDSFTKGQIYSPSGLIGDKPNVSWGACIGRVYGVESNIYASSGADTNTWQTRQDCMPKALSEDASGLYLLCLGINDSMYVTLGSITDITSHSSYTDYPNTFYGNYGKIIEQLKAHAPNSKLVMIKPFYPITHNYYRWSSSAIDEIANHYGIPVVDTKDSILAQSSFFIDGMVGGHPTVALHSAMANDLSKLLSRCMMDNYEYFKTYYGV